MINNYFKCYRTIIVFFSILNIIFFCSCTTDIENREEIADKQFKYEIIRGKSEPDSICIIVDITTSMKGFSAARDSMEEFYSRIEHGLYPKTVQYFTVSDTILKITNYRELLKDNLYNDKEVDFSKIESELTEDKLTILITDLQFNTDEFFDKFIRILQNQVHSNKLVKLSAAKLFFDGRYFPRNLPPGRSQPGYKGLRPIYAIIIAPKKYFTFIQNTGFAGLSMWKESFTFYKDHQMSKVVCSTDNIEQYYDKNPPFFDERVDNNSLEIFKVKSNSIVFDLILQNTLFAEWDSLSSDDIHIEFYHWNKNDEQFIQSLPMKDKISGINLAKDSLKFRLFLDRINPHPPKLNRIVIEPKVLPNWIDTWSCSRNDNWRLEADHTFRFKDFVNYILLSDTRPFVLTTVHLHIY